MEQVYNYTQNDTSSSSNGIRNYANDLKDKVSQLKGTANTKSTTELTTVKKYDIQNNSKGTHLTTKAGQLKEKAQSLHGAAETLATSGPSALQSPAGNLKDAAKKSGDDHLFDAANQLATQESDLENKAEKVIQKFEAVKQAYIALSAQAKGVTGLSAEQQQLVTAVTTEYTELEDIYDGMLNLTKLAVKANALQGGGTLTEAGNLATAVKTLRDNTDGNDYPKAQSVIQNYGSVQNPYYTLPEDQKKPNVKDQFDAFNDVYDRIRIHYSKILQNAAGTGPGAGLRQLADTIYTRAEQLHNAVTNVSAPDGNAAKVLKAKAGTGNSNGLRGLAKDLYEKANALATAAGGADETTGTTLRKTLKDLNDESSDSQLPTKASEVISQYSQVSRAFTQVQAQAATAYNDGDKQNKYQAVEKAWNAFNAVYKPEEQFATAIGDQDQAPHPPGSDPTTLRQALHQLGDASILSPGVHKKADDVKTQYNTVKSKFDLVKAQESAYSADSSNIKTEKYIPLEGAFNNFNTDYRETTYPTKFYSIVITFIISILSDCSPKTSVLLYDGDKKDKFGGWTDYKANKFGNTGPQPGVDVYGWICYFFDIIH